MKLKERNLSDFNSSSEIFQVKTSKDLNSFLLKVKTG